MKEERGTGIHRKNVFSFLKVGSEYEKGINGLIDHKRVFTPDASGTAAASFGISSEVDIISPGTGTGTQAVAGASFSVNTAGVLDTDFMIASNYGLLYHMVPTTISEGYGMAGVIMNLGGGVATRAAGSMGFIYAPFSAEFGTVSGLRSYFVSLPGATFTAGYCSGLDIDFSFNHPTAIDYAYGIRIDDVDFSSEESSGINIRSVVTSGTQTFGIYIGGASGGSVNNRGIHIGEVSGTASSNVALYLSDVSGGSFTNHGIRIGDITGGTVAYGVQIGAVTGATTNYALYTNAGTVLFGDRVQLQASTTSKAMLRLPHGVAPTVPADGDIWTTTTSAYARINGVTIDLGSGGGGVSAIDDLSDAITDANSVFLGSGSGVSNTGNTANVALGISALASVTTGQSNVGLGYLALNALTTSSYNTAVGIYAGGRNIGRQNTFIGASAGYSAVSATARDNVAIGLYSGLALTSASRNVFIGNNSGYRVTTGSNNTAIGYSSLSYLTNGIENVAIGYNAGFTLATANGCTFIGYEAGYSSIGIGNTAIGKNAFRAGTGTYNVAIGLGALTSAGTHQANVAIGWNAGQSITTSGNGNVMIGQTAGVNTTASSGNVFIGSQAGYTNISGDNAIYIGKDAAFLGTQNDNIAIGGDAAYYGTGVNNISIGRYANRYNTTGTYNLFMGYQAGQGVSTATTGSFNTVIGHSALKVYTSAHSNTIIGYNAASSLLQGNENVAIGLDALSSDLTAGKNVAIGSQALKVSTRSSTTAIGYAALASNTIGTSNTAIGYQALDDNTEGDNNTAVGFTALDYNITGSRNTGIGYAALYTSTGSDNVGLGNSAGMRIGSGSYNVAIGSLSLSTTGVKTENTAIGYATGLALTTGSKHVLIGYRAGANLTTQSQSVFIGYDAGYSATVTNATGIGFNSLKVSTGSANTAIGGYTLGLNTTGHNNAAVGYQTLSNSVSGNYNVAFGSQALNQNLTGSSNTAIGYRANYAATAGNSNVYVGTFSGENNLSNNNVVIGQTAGRGSTGSSYHSTVAVGTASLNAITSGARNVSVGYQAGLLLTTGDANVLIGYQAGAQLTTESNLLIIANTNTLTPLIHGNFSTSMVTINDDLTVEGEIYGGDATTESLALIDNAVDLNRINLDATPAPNDPAFYPDTTDSITLGALANVWAEFYSKTISDTGTSVGIGTQIPYATLDVSGSVRVLANNKFILGGTGGAVSNRAFITSPAADVIEMEGSTSSTRGLTVELTSNSATAATHSSLYFNRYDQVADGDYLGSILFRGHDDADDEYAGVQIIGTGRETWRSPGLASQLDIQVHDGTSMASRMLIDGGDISIDANVEIDGDFTLLDTYWEDVRVPMTATKGGGVSDPGYAQFMDNGSGSTGVYAWMFDPSSEEELFFEMQIPHAYKEGTDLEIHVHWSPMTTNTGDVRWGLEYTWINIDGTFGNTTIIYALDTASGTAKDHQVKDFASISGTGMKISSMLMCRVFRDAGNAADTFTGDAALLEVDAHIEVNTLGSRQEYVK